MSRFRQNATAAPLSPAPRRFVIAGGFVASWRLEEGSAILVLMRDLPSGTVSFLFTDVEGSTKLLHDLGAEQYSRVLATHRRVLREAFAANQGVEVDTQGDAFFVAFLTAPGALEAAAKALERLGQGPIRVRMGIHTGTPHLGDEGYVGVDVHRAARIAAAGHGGQVLSLPRALRLWARTGCATWASTA